MLVGLVALVAVGLFVRARTTRAPAAQSGRRDDANRPVPVLLATAELRDVPVFLEGLGTVAANYTVTVRPRVDGRLESVAFTEGQTVHQGDLLAVIDPRPFRIALQQAEALVARDRAALALHRREAERSRGLVENQFIAPAEYDTARGNVAQSEAALRGDEAQVAAARLNLSYTRVTAPIDGVVGLRQVDPGNMVRAADTTGLVVLTQVDPIAVLFSLPQDTLPDVAAQMARGPLSVDVYARDGDAPLATGRLAVIDNQINAATATVRLKALFANPDRRLWPEQFVKARLRLDTRRGALTIPAAAVQRGPQGTFVYVVADDQTASPREVTVDRVEGELALIATGLRAGERVVTEGQSRLRAGARVQPRGQGDGEAGDGGARRRGGGDGGGGGGRRRGGRRDGGA
ncbi:MAG: efflux RND transporter periplasmic adaptor subunit [Polyangiales bacterium]